MALVLLTPGLGTRLACHLGGGEVGLYGFFQNMSSYPAPMPLLLVWGGVNLGQHPKITLTLDTNCNQGSLRPAVGTTGCL